MTISQEIDKARTTRKKRKKLAVVHWLDSENIAATNTDRPHPINTMAGPWRGRGRGGGEGGKAPPCRARDRTSKDGKNRIAKGRGSSAKELKMEDYYTRTPRKKQKGNESSL